MAETTAAGLLAVVGIFDIVGTIASGWLTAGFVRDSTGEYTIAWFGARGLCIVAAVVSIGIATRASPMREPVG